MFRFGIWHPGVSPICLALLLWGLTVGIPGQAAEADVEQLVGLLELVLDADPDTARECLLVVTQKVQSGELGAPQLQAVRSRLGPKFAAIMEEGPQAHLFLEVAILSAAWKDRAALDALRRIAAARDAPIPQRVRAFDALAVAKDDTLPAVSAQVLIDPGSSHELLSSVISALARLDSPAVAELLLDHYSRLDPVLQPRIVEVLTQRASWSRRLLTAIGAKRLPAAMLNENQVRKMIALKDPELVELVGKHWGAVRLDRDPNREQVIADVRRTLRDVAGDPHRGQQVFQKVCGQCHRIYGSGAEVGPDLTANGRNNFDQLLSNVLDPSLVIGASYQARTVATNEGRVLTGLLVEDSPQRIVLKVQGGKLETVARDDIDALQVSSLSMMPEGLEKQLQLQELVDLFWFLCLDRPPGDPDASLIPGSQLK